MKRFLFFTVYRLIQFARKTTEKIGMTRFLQITAIAILLGLIALGLTTEVWLAPLRPGGSWLVLKVVPLLAALHGFLYGRRYTFQWMSLLVWMYFAEGVVRATSSAANFAALLGVFEAAMALALFGFCAAYARKTRLS